MTNDEILILILYFFIVVHICYYNNKMIQSLKNVNNKRRLNKFLTTENRYIETYTFLSVVGIVVLYFNFSSYAYFIYLFETLILIFSFSSLKRNILKKFN